MAEAKSTQPKKVQSTNVWLGMNKKFSLSNFKHNWELAPLVCMPLLAVTMAVCMLFRTATTAPDIRFANKDDSYRGPHESIKGNQDVKLKTNNPAKFKKNPEFERLKEDMKKTTPKKEAR